MAIEPGTRFGPYEIVDAIGAGGMGEVYRATDTKLGREVAIKTLPSALASDTDRLARFEREAKLLATLNHPNIAVIYGLEEKDGTQCIAMELIEGETLEEKLKDGPLPVEDALRLALQIAQALEAAHDKGVVHRDLKPANVMVARDGIVKVLDFGLAKALSENLDQASLGQSPALSLAMTQQGIVLGTASYMSPEQASGQATDQRADVWAFGVVLFEMLSGLPLFTGESVPHILADVLRADPDWNRLPKNLHPRLRLLLERCLEKKTRDRYHAIADARIDIEQVLSDPDGPQAGGEAREIAYVRPILPWVAASLASGAAIVGLLAWSLQPTRQPVRVERFDYDLPADHALRTFQGRHIMALSPNGRQFAYNTLGGLYLRAMDDLEARLIPGTEPFLTSPIFSPDSQWVAYFDAPDQQLKRIAISGGAPAVIADASNPLGLSWAADGTILFGQLDGIFSVSANGGIPELVIPNDDGTFFSSPEFLPDGDSVMFTASPVGDVSETQTLVESLSTGERAVLVEGGGEAHYVSTGHLVYTIEDGLFAVLFDPDTLTVSGGAVPLVQGVMRAGTFGWANYSVSEDGRLVYVTGTAAVEERTLVWVDREGREETIDSLPRYYNTPRISPDGTRLALDVRDQELDIWVWDFARETLTRLTFDPGEDEFPLWSPDGQRIVFSSSRDGGSGADSDLFWKAADGSGSVEHLAEGNGQTFPTSFLPDETGILVFGASVGEGENDDIAIFRMDGEEQTIPLLDTTFTERTPMLSPDGRWLAYSSNESGTDEVYVRPFPEIDAGRWQVSAGGGTQPLWARNGEELFYRNGDAMVVVTVQADSSFSVGNPEILFEGTYAMGDGEPSYDVSLDGERFLMIKQMEDGSATAQVIVVLNWLTELERLVPTE